MSWLESLIYGFVSGFAEFLPISAEAHRSLLYLMMGVEASPLLELTVHIGALLALLLCCWPQLCKLQRERKIAAIPARRRKRQPDPRCLHDLQFLRVAVVPVLAAFALLTMLRKLMCGNLWLTALILLVNGLILYLPPYFPGGNRDSRNVSALDGLLVGLGGALAVVPGISRITGITAVGQLRHYDRSYILNAGLILCIPALFVLVLFDIFALFTATVAVAGGFLSCLIAVITSFAAAYLGITFIRFLAVKVGFSGFAYYSWGAALFTFILYLSI